MKNKKLLIANLQKMKISVGEFTKEINEEILKEGEIDIDFDGKLMVKILINEGQMKVINAMDGYGNNCKEDYEEEIVHIMPSLTEGDKILNRRWSDWKAQRMDELSGTVNNVSPFER